MAGSYAHTYVIGFSLFLTSQNQCPAPSKTCHAHLQLPDPLLAKLGLFASFLKLTQKVLVNPTLLPDLVVRSDENKSPTPPSTDFRTFQGLGIESYFMTTAYRKDVSHVLM